MFSGHREKKISSGSSTSSSVPSWKGLGEKAGSGKKAGKKSGGTGGTGGTGGRGEDSSGGGKSQPVSSDDDEFSDGNVNSDDDDVNSNGSMKDDDNEQPEDDQVLQERLHDIMENINSKRAATREEALIDLRKLMTARYLAGPLEGKIETLLELLKKSVRRGSPIENQIAAEAVTLCFLLLGPDNESIFAENVRPFFQDSVRTGQDNSPKPAFLQALGIGCFILSTEVDSTSATMDFFEEVFSRNYADEITAAAVEYWSLLVTTAPPTRLPGLVQRNIKQLKKHLTSENSDLRIASGLSIALLYDICRESEQEFPITDESYDELMEALNLLAKDTDRHKAKKERSKQKSIFRDVLRTMEGGSFSEQVLRFKQEQVELTSWSKVRQLETLRELLGEGLHVHFQQNDTIRQIFDLPPASLVTDEPGSKMTSIEKRMYYSPNSPAAKARSKWLDSRRSNKQSSQNSGWA